MAWTAPATFTDGAILTAAQLNAMRDNFNETAPAKATSAGGFIVTTALNSVVQRTPAMTQIDTSESTASTSFTDLATLGPVVTITTGGSALVAVGARIAKSFENTAGVTAYAVSGASTIAANDDRGVIADGMPANQSVRMSATSLQTGLVPGSNTFTQKYKVSSVTGTFTFRHLAVIPF